MPLGVALDALGDAAADLAGAFGFSLTDNKPIDPVYKEAKDKKAFGEGVTTPWEIVGTDWHKVYGYQFVIAKLETPAQAQPNPGSNFFTNFAGFGAAIESAFDAAVSAIGLSEESSPVSDYFYYTLPIPPQSYNEKMVIASQATATIGGVVEETNKNVFWNISMGGTTGIAVTRGATDVTNGRNKMATIFRDTIKTTGLMSGALAQVNSVLSQVGGIADQVIQTGTALANGDIGGAAAAAVQAAQVKLLPAMPYAGSAVDRETNGFTEAHELMRFLYTYSALRDTNPDGYHLFFRNYKTGKQFRCVIQDLSLQQSVQDPMLVRYTIVLKCWDVTPLTEAEKSKAEYDRFGPGGDLYPSALINLDQMNKLNGILNGNVSADETLNTLLG
jgi:hypothetical protein